MREASQREGGKEGKRGRDRDRDRQTQTHTHTQREREREREREKETPFIARAAITSRLDADERIKGAAGPAPRLSCSPYLSAAKQLPYPVAGDCCRLRLLRALPCSWRWGERRGPSRQAGCAAATRGATVSLCGVARRRPRPLQAAGRRRGLRRAAGGTRRALRHTEAGDDTDRDPSLNFGAVAERRRRARSRAGDAVLGHGPGTRWKPHTHTNRARRCCIRVVRAGGRATLVACSEGPPSESCARAGAVGVGGGAGLRPQQRGGKGRLVQARRGRGGREGEGGRERL